ncbi:hypothetical protein QVD17_20765 [Tagetes erecta]|uniref:Glycosyltransferase n=1 Tax=Tagetes erecta TaxID=13708 RepID=A0AAD8KMA3_TARER|nr:hypothetical protein QVD17_20765 [Tagetes erecta]
MSANNDGAIFPAADVAVVMVPLVAEGHLTQLLHLSTIISSYNLPIHFITTTTSLHQLQSRHRTTTVNIHFHHFPVPPFISPPPQPSTPFPTHLQPYINSTLHLRHPTATLIRSLSEKHRRVVVIHDVLMSYVVQDVVSIANAETYLFQPLSAFNSASSLWEKTGGSFPEDFELMNMIPSKDGIASPEFLEFVELQKPCMGFYVGELYDSCRVVEGKFIEYLEKVGQKKIWAVGPFNPVRIASDSTDLNNRHKCLQWLDEQPKNSVVYVSFGTTTTFNDEQIRELALGLERSGERFIWVVRAADVGDSCGFEGRKVELPDGFEERVKGRGLVERGWAPQLQILEHFATGAFLSHCGWNSSMESISMGVPMATWPMHSDQPRNAFLITNILRIGVAVRSWERRDELVTADVVAEAVKTLMDSEKGEETRRRVMKLSGEVRESMAEGGISRMEMDSFISYARRL